jgi:hypothetical protein
MNAGKSKNVRKVADKIRIHRRAAAVCSRMLRYTGIDIK